MPNKAAGGIRMQLRWELSVLGSGIQSTGLFSDNAASIFTLQIPPRIPNVCAQAPEPTQPAPQRAQASSARPHNSHRARSSRTAQLQPFQAHGGRCRASPLRYAPASAGLGAVGAGCFRVRIHITIVTSGAWPRPEAQEELAPFLNRAAA